MAARFLTSQSLGSTVSRALRWPAAPPGAGAEGWKDETSQEPHWDLVLGAKIVMGSGGHALRSEFLTRHRVQPGKGLGVAGCLHHAPASRPGFDN